MSLYRCAACGSPNVKIDTQAAGVGYNYVKGAVGTVVLGVGGAAAGIESKQQQVFKCPDCGMTMTYSMPEEVKSIVDLGVMNANARNSLTLMGVHMDWSTLKAQYKNIESGAGDEMERRQKEYDLSNSSWFNEFIADSKKDIEQYKAAHMSDPEYLKWLNDVADAERKIKEELPRETEIQKQENLRWWKERKISLKPLLEDKIRLQQKMSSLGLFKGAEKQALRAEIAALDKKIEEGKKNNKEIDDYLSSMDDHMQQIDAEVEAEKVLKEKYIPKAPSKKMQRIAFLDDREKETGKYNKMGRRAIIGYRFLIYFLEINGKTNLSDITDRDGNALFWTTTMEDAGEWPSKSSMRAWINGLVKANLAIYDKAANTIELID